MTNASLGITSRLPTMHSELIAEAHSPDVVDRGLHGLCSQGTKLPALRWCGELSLAATTLSLVSICRLPQGPERRRGMLRRRGPERIVTNVSR